MAGSQTSYTQLRIDPLSRENAEALLEALLGTDPGLGALKRLLIERTEGNPLFVEESVRTLAETEALTGKRGAYRLARDLPAIQVPGTVQAILAARIDRLAAEEKQLLEMAAVIGKDFPFALLQAVAERAEEMLRRGLASSSTAEFVYETRSSPTWSTPSSTRSRMRSPTAVFSTSGGGTSTQGSSGRWSVSTGSPWRADRAAGSSFAPRRPAGEGGALS